jgi:hypothetical protein
VELGMATLHDVDADGRGGNSNRNQRGNPSLFQTPFIEKVRFENLDAILFPPREPLCIKNPTPAIINPFIFLQCSITSITG